MNPEFKQSCRQSKSNQTQSTQHRHQIVWEDISYTVRSLAGALYEHPQNATKYHIKYAILYKHQPKTHANVWKLSCKQVSIKLSVFTSGSAKRPHSNE